MSNNVGLSSRFNTNTCSAQKRHCCKEVKGIYGKARLCLLSGKHVKHTKCCKPKKSKKCCC